MLGNALTIPMALLNPPTAWDFFRKHFPRLSTRTTLANGSTQSQKEHSSSFMHKSWQFSGVEVAETRFG